MLTPEQEARLFSGVSVADEYFRREGAILRALENLTRLLDESCIEYAITGAMGLTAYGFYRFPNHIDVLLTDEGLARFKAQHPGYAETPRGMLDSTNGVHINVQLAGKYPGDGKPKAVKFPDPSSSVAGERIRVLPMETLIELKLASGISTVSRLKDLADILELIQAIDLPADFADRLDPSVRPKFQELWQAAQSPEA